MFRFASPYVLLLLALIPLTVLYRRRGQPAALASAGIGPAVVLPKTTAVTLSRLVPGLYYAALILMVAALARPQWGTQKIVMNTKGINIILAVDLSESMGALDFRLDGQIVNRLEAVKSVVRDFVAHRSGDRIGMVVFGSQAYTQLPLTRDYTTIVAMLDRLAIGAAGRQTAVGDAVGIALKRIADIDSRSNVIILLTDGRSNSGELDPLAAADIAREKEVKIYAIGVGSQGQAPFLINDPVYGKRYVYQQVDLDETTLQQMAQRTDGMYFRAKDTEGLQKIYTTIDNLEKTEVKVDAFAQYDELYVYLLVPALVLLGFWIVLANTRFLKIP
jgi:Ca-activated chloride channel family protein